MLAMRAAMGGGLDSQGCVSKLSLSSYTRKASMMRRLMPFVVPLVLVLASCTTSSDPTASDPTPTGPTTPTATAAATATATATFTGESCAYCRASDLVAGLLCQS